MLGTFISDIRLKAAYVGEQYNRSKSETTIMDEAINYLGTTPQDGRNDFSRSVAKLLLKRIFCEMLKGNQDLSLKNIDLLIEATRIIALDLIIARCLRLPEVEVSCDPKFGVTCVSNERLSDPELTSKIFNLVNNYITKFKNFPLLAEIEKLDRYDVVKILEAIHEVSVYTPLEYIEDSINFRTYVSEVNDIRKQRGAFYTPTEIAEFICENTIGTFLDERIDNINKIFEKTSEVAKYLLKEIERIFEIRIIDPACGPGTFLTSSLKILAKRRCKLLETVKKFLTYPLTEIEKAKVSNWIHTLEEEDEFLKYFANSLYGVDLDSSALEVTSICLSLLCRRNQISDGLKVYYMTNLKEGNSLISELPLKSVKLDLNQLKMILDIRRRVHCKNLEERKEVVKHYKSIIKHFQRHSHTLQTVKKASEFFKNLDEKKAFCWELEFPEIFYTGDGHPEKGFDILVMNPPYDLLKPNRLEYIKVYGSKHVSTDAFEIFKRTLFEEVKFYREAGHYRMATSNVLNLYRLMIERALYLTSSNGILGFIVPSTLLCDESAARLRKEILNKYKVEGVFDFLESAKVFPGVSQAVCIMIINKASKGEYIPLVMNITHMNDFKKISPVVIPINWLKDFSGFRIPKVTEKGWEILRKIHVNPKLSDIPWVLNLRGEVDLTFYRDCLSTKNTGHPLVRGADISRYVLKRKCLKKESFIDREKFIIRLGNSVKREHVEDIRIVGQQISNMTQRWRLKFCMVEAGTFVGNSCNYIYIKKEQRQRNFLYLYILALLNSILLNWRFKLTSSNNHISNKELGMLPIKLPDMLNAREKNICDLIVKRTKEIIQKGVSRFDSVIEAAIFLLYGLTEDEIKIIMCSEKADEQELNNVLEAYRKVSKIDDNFTNW
jgi:Alw26I/Eco31I/Esp3I family type II restriction m6 adenine DNA methyltransferase